MTCSRLARGALGILLLILYPGWCSAQQPPELVQALTGSDTLPQDFFGRALAMDGDVAVVGAENNLPGGTAYVFRRTASGWVEEQRLDPPTLVIGDKFGGGLAVSGDTIVVGAPLHDNAHGNNSGAVHVFEYENGSWGFQQTLMAPDGFGGGMLGLYLAVDGDCLAFGGGVSDRVYVFERSGSVWNDVAILEARGVSSIQSMDVGNGRIAFGDFASASGGVSLAGAVFVYRRETAGWILEQTLASDDLATQDLFGYRVELDGDRLIASAVEKEELGVYCGAAYVFHRTGSLWSQEAKLIATDGDQVRDFGFRVDLDGEIASIVQGQGRGGEPPSAFYVFRRTGTVWDTGVKTIPPVSSGAATPMALSGNRILVGSELDSVANLYLVPEPPTIYCSAKVNSAGCLPQIGFTGSATLTGPDDFVATAIDTLPSHPGLFFFGLQGSTDLPFLGGTLCVLPPLARTPVQVSTTGVACDGTYAFPFTRALMNQYGLIPGDRFHGQYWTRDRAHPDGTGVGLTDALDVLILP